MRRSALPCMILAAALGSLYVILAPVSADLAAAVFRSGLFARQGFVSWNDAWYGGHDLPAYSVLMPPLGAALGPRVVAALAAVASAGLFAALVEHAYPRRNVRLAALWFAGAVGLQLLTGRVTWMLGLAVGLAAVLAAQRGRWIAAAVLGVLTPLASPVAGAFLALAGATWAVGSRRRRGLLLAAAGVAPVVALVVVFPEGGTEPFVPSAFWPALAALLALSLLLPRDERLLRAGAALYAVALVLCFVVPTAVGGNVTRLAALTAGPLVACALWPRRPLLLALVAVPLVYWQVMPPIRDVVVSSGDPSTRAAYYAPLVHRLDREPRPLRVEVPFTRSHWEAAWLAAHVPIARGWERQLDRARNPLFYDDRPLTATRYTAWLRANAVGFVAVPDVPLDVSAIREAALIRSGVPALRLVWRNAHWRLYRVTGARPLGARRIGGAGFVLHAARPGVHVVRVRFSPHWAIVQGSGCVSRTTDGFTRVRATRPGVVRVAIDVDARQLLVSRSGERCTR